ncbi:MAG: glycoside hydrolase family 13 protein [Streptosporangiaceae bacterium]
MTTHTPWWRDAVIYEVYPRSFADSDGDGEGDLEGLRSHLPYLRDLGVDALWLSPFYRSPLADGGYDVADYRDVDPRFGTLADFDRLIAEVHGHGMRLVVDIVPNHTSSAHPWFQEALTGVGRDRYIFRNDTGIPNDWQSNFGGPAWTRLPDGEWYLHLYTPAQPDLNWRNPEIRKEFEDIVRFWLDRGVDGFRIDVAAGLFKDEHLSDIGDLTPHAAGSPMYDRPEVHDVYRDWRLILDSYPGDRMAVGEVWTEAPDDLARYVRPDELHQVFRFDLQKAPWSAAEFRRVVEESLGSATAAAPTWVLSSHDSVRHVTRYSSLDRARAALLFMLALPGSAYLYQGEELGLAEVTDLPDEVRQDPIWFQTHGAQPGRDGCRVPLPWSGTEPPFGFSTGEPWLPQPRSWAAQTAAAQLGDPTSTLKFYRQALALRRTLRGTLPEQPEWLDGFPPEVLAFRRGSLTCVTNFGDVPVSVFTSSSTGTVALASGPLDGDRLPGGAAVWLTGECLLSPRAVRRCVP